MLYIFKYIQLLEYPIPPAAAASQKPSPGDISATKRAIIDPLDKISGKNLRRKIRNFLNKLK